MSGHWTGYIGNLHVHWDTLITMWTVTTLNLSFSVPFPSITSEGVAVNSKGSTLE